MPNREYYDQISPRRRCSEKLPAFLAARISCGNDRVGPPDGLLDFRRVNSMPINMADIVQIPIEAFQAVEHNYSIYKVCIYNKRSEAAIFRVWVRTPSSRQAGAIFRCSTRRPPAAT